jgi:hypothetical protein
VNGLVRELDAGLDSGLNAHDWVNSVTEESYLTHKVHECTAMNAVWVCHEAGKMNCSDVLTNFLGYDGHYKCCGYILFR